MPTCIQCGAKVEPGAASCMACGLPMPASPLGAGEAPTAPAEPTAPPLPVAAVPPQAPPADPAAPAATADVTKAAASPTEGSAAEGTRAPNTLVRNVLIGAGAVALVTALAWAYFAFAAGVGVPDLSGKSKAQTLTALATVKLRLGRVTYDQSARAAQGAVIAQDPKAGARLGEGAPVNVTIAGPPPVVTPDLTGLAESAAATIVTDSGLQPGARSTAYSDTVARGAVCSQDPSQGVEAPRGSAVAIIISRGPQPVRVPKVVKEALKDATRALKAAGFTVSSTTKSSSSKKSSVLSQSPAGGSMAQPGARVKLTVSSGVVMVTVPNAVSAALNHNYGGSGSVESQVRAVVGAVLSRAGLRMNLVLGPSSGTNSQSPRAGARVPRGSTVTVRLAVGD